MSLPRTIAALMTRSPVVVRPEQSLAVAHALMREKSVRHLPVVDGGRLVGVVSLSDLRLLESLDDVDLQTVPVEEAMIHGPYAVGIDAPVDDVLGHMLAHRIDAVLVVERGALVGIFTHVDAMRALRVVMTFADDSESEVSGAQDHDRR